MFFLLFFFSSQNFRRGGALAPCIDAPPLVLENRERRDDTESQDRMPTREDIEMESEA